MVDEVLGVVEALPDMGTLPLRYEIGMGVVCYTLILSIRKGKYSGHLQWDRTIKFTTLCTLGSVGVKGPYLLRMRDKLWPLNASPEGHGS